MEKETALTTGNILLYWPLRFSFFIGLFALSLLTACTSSDPILAQVGPTPIKLSEARLRDEVHEFYYPNPPSKQGLRQLIQTQVYLQILKKYGQEITPEEVQLEARRIDHDTKSPGKLQALKNIFSSHPDLYLPLFVRPLLAAQKIQYQFFPQEARIHQERFQEADAYRKQVTLDPTHFVEFAKKRGRMTGIIEYNGKTLSWKNDQNETLDTEDELNPTEISEWNELSQLSSNSVYPKVLSYSNHFRVIKKLPAPNQKIHRFQYSYFPKVNFAEWIAHEKTQISIQLFVPDESAYSDR